MFACLAVQAPADSVLLNVPQHTEHSRHVVLEGTLSGLEKYLHRPILPDSALCERIESVIMTISAHGKLSVIITETPKIVRKHVKTGFFLSSKTSRSPKLENNQKYNSTSSIAKNVFLSYLTLISLCTPKLFLLLYRTSLTSLKKKV